jgi:hypothetical protein
MTKEQDSSSSRSPRGCHSRRPWPGGASRAGFQPPGVGRHVKASQALPPSLSKEGNFLGTSFTYVAPYRTRLA